MGQACGASEPIASAAIRPVPLPKGADSTVGQTHRQTHQSDPPSWWCELRPKARAGPC